MIGCSSQSGRAGGASGSRMTGFGSSSTPLSDHLEMVSKRHSRDDAESDSGPQLYLPMQCSLDHLSSSRRPSSVTFFSNKDNSSFSTKDVEAAEAEEDEQQADCGLSRKSANLSDDDENEDVTDDGVRNSKHRCGMTNFHITLLLGMIGFVLFWLGLLLRIYLPGELFHHQAS